MYWDRKNIEPEYLVEISTLTPNKHGTAFLEFFVQININIENRGSRSLAFSNYRLRLIEEDDKELTIPAVKVWIKEIGKSYAIGSATEIVAPNQIKDICIDFPDNNSNYPIYNKLFDPKIKKFISLSTIN